jgi:hypothetical protein
VKSLGKIEEETLYRDAIFVRLLREGMNEYQAKVEAERQMLRKKEL